MGPVAQAHGVATGPRVAAAAALGCATRAKQLAREAGQGCRASAEISARARTTRPGCHSHATLVGVGVFVFMGILKEGEREGDKEGICFIRFCSYSYFYSYSSYKPSFLHAMIFCAHALVGSTPAAHAGPITRWCERARSEWRQF